MEKKSKSNLQSKKRGATPLQTKQKPYKQGLKPLLFYYTYLYLLRYAYIAGQNKQKLLLETFRVLKKGGVFVIHDLMNKSSYGDMNKFMEKLKKDGYQDVQLIDTTKGLFMGHKEALLLGLSGSTLLIGRK